MRIKNSMKNIFMSIFSQLVIILLGFISRKVFIDSLGTEYLGINGVLTNVISAMVLIESGLGVSITYNLYKPLAENDKSTIISLVQLYKKVYSCLAILLFIISLGIYPILLKLMKGTEGISNITLVYYLFVAKNMVSYITAYKWALINADQKEYILSASNLMFQVLSTIGKIIVLMITSNYILYLIIDTLIYIVQVLFNGHIVNRKYSYIKTKQKYNLDSKIKSNIIMNVKAMFWHNIGGYCVASTDNILISTINVTLVGIYSNYTLVIGQLSALLTPVLNGIGASVGNLIATEGNKKTYKVYKVSYLINFWICSFCVIFLYNLLEPFIEWAFKEGLLLDRFTYIIILINFYISGMRNTIITFKNKAGLFVQDQYMPAIEGIMNLVISLILMKYLGMVGVFLGTTLSTLMIPFWNQPRILYKNLFDISVGYYFKDYTKYTLLMLVSGVITTIICNKIYIDILFLSLVIKGFICIFIPNIIYVIVFYNNDEFKYLLSVMNIILDPVKKRMGMKLNEVRE